MEEEYIGPGIEQSLCLLGDQKCIIILTTLAPSPSIIEGLRARVV